MAKRTKDTIAIIHTLDEIPQDMTEAEEHQFWSTHTLSEQLVAQAEPLPADVVALLDRIRENRERRKAAAHPDLDASTRSGTTSSTNR
jgi:hypothetical protein